MKRILIFEPQVSGHHLEYLHHIYLNALEDSTNIYYFIVPSEFDRTKSKYEWQLKENIKISFIDSTQLKRYFSYNYFYKSNMIKKYALKFKVNEIFLPQLTIALPFLPLLLPSSIKITGIIYKIPDLKGTFKNHLDRIRYYLSIHNKSLKSILVLNDCKAVQELNTEFNTAKFKFLPDPVPIDQSIVVCNLRLKLNIPKNSQVYIHFGALDRRKGTLEILNALLIGDIKSYENKYFVFAGKVNSTIEKEFYTLVKKVEDKGIKLRIFNEFCDYQFLFDLCYSADCILIPYYNYNQSSGVIGYSSFFKKPVIGPGKGLLGTLIKEYSLGVTISDITPENILNAINKDLPTVTSEYFETHKIPQFQQIISHSLQA